MKSNYAMLFCSLILLGLQSCEKAPIEPVHINQPISAKPDKIIAMAGGDFALSLPIKNIYLDGSGTLSENEENLNLEYEWSCLSYPSSAVAPFIELPVELVTRVFHIYEGAYLFQLKVKHQDRIAFDTVKVVMNPDPLKGKNIIYENQIWDEIHFGLRDIGFFEYYKIGIVLISADFYFRDINDLKIEFWDEDKLTWYPLKRDDYYFGKPGELVLFHPDYLNNKVYGTKTKIRVSFL